MLYAVEIMINGMVFGSVYALIALGFVVVYKASRIINFALGEFTMVAANLVAVGIHVFELGLVFSILFGFLGMALLCLIFNRLVLHYVIGRPVVSLIMVTIGLGSFLRAGAAVLFGGSAKSIPLPISREPIEVMKILLTPGEVLAGALALVCIAAVSWFFMRTRTGVALRAIADDQQAAMLVGIGIEKYFAITWVLAGAIAVVGGTLWSFVSSGGFSIVLVGLKVFPIVIIGGLDSIVGVIVGGVLVGLLEALAAGYLDPIVGGGFSGVASYMVLIAVLMVRPSGLFGREEIRRV